MKVETAIRLLRRMDSQAVLMIEVPSKTGGSLRYHAREVYEPHAIASSGSRERKAIIRSEQ